MTVLIEKEVADVMARRKRRREEKTSFFSFSFNTTATATETAWPTDVTPANESKALKNEDVKEETAVLTLHKK